MPVNVTARSPCLIRPAIPRSAFQARVLTEPREVVSHTRPPEYAKTSGVRCGPRGVVVATAQKGPCLEDLLDRRREETHPLTASLPAPGGSASIAPVQRIWLPRLASTPPDHHASPVHRAPPTIAPARIGRLRLGPFATT